MEKLHRFSKQKVLLNVKNGVCICMSLSFLGGWNIQDVVPKVESRGPWVKVLYNFYKPEQNQARWYLWLSRPSYRQILPDQDPPSTFFSILSSSPCLARHYSSHQQNYTSNNDRMLMCNVPNSRSVVVIHCCWSHTTDALASSRALSRSTELSSRQVIGWCLHHPWHAPPPPLDTSVVFIRAEEPCAILC